MGEVKDILLVQFAVTNAHTAGKLSNQWRLMITIVSKVRRWVFVPALMLTVVGMVVYSPGTPMNIAFNTLALLFIVSRRALLPMIAHALHHLERDFAPDLLRHMSVYL